MLLTVETSRSSKTRGCAVTYRAAPKEMFGTCPDTCGMKPKNTGTVEIDRDYEKALGDAVPKGGWSWLYSHFSPDGWKHKNGPGRTVFNFSADTIADAVKYFQRGVPVVTVVPDMYWKERRAFKQDGLTFMRCPAEGPLCARADRRFAVAFTAHGPDKRRAGDPDDPGGCYAACGNCAIHWRRLAELSPDAETEAEHVTRFAAGLRRGSRLRHHVAGDTGLAA
jgi:hypothetical protein